MTDTHKYHTAANRLHQSEHHVAAILVFRRLLSVELSTIVKMISFYVAAEAGGGGERRKIVSGMFVCLNLMSAWEWSLALL